jgi:hemerythrin-like domain-containing protein
MDAIEILMNEHRLIERVCDALEGFADTAARRAGEDKAELAKFVAFISRFADGWHHGKEEDILFAAMVEHGFPREGGPVAVMLHEHDQGRRLVAILRGYAAQADAWSDADRQEIARAAAGFAQLLRAHIQKEDQILYPMAEQHLPPEAMAAVAEACERYESSAGAHEKLRVLGDELVRAHAPAAQFAAPSTQRFGCCG